MPRPHQTLSKSTSRFIKPSNTKSTIGKPKTPRDAAKPEQTQMDEHEDKKQPGRMDFDFTKTIDCDDFAEMTFMAALCIMISLVFWTGTFSL
jgi:hypothetical protein